MVGATFRVEISMQAEFARELVPATATFDTTSGESRLRVEFPRALTYLSEMQ
jgi:hypothetical protein